MNNSSNSNCLIYGKSITTLIYVKSIKKSLNRLKVSTSLPQCHLALLLWVFFFSSKSLRIYCSEFTNTSHCMSHLSCFVHSCNGNDLRCFYYIALEAFSYYDCFSIEKDFFFVFYAVAFIFYVYRFASAFYSISINAHSTYSHSSFPCLELNLSSSFLSVFLLLDREFHLSFNFISTVYLL